MNLQGKSLGLLVSIGPDHPRFRHATSLAQAALRRGLKVYWYGVDEGVRDIDHPTLQLLRDQGLNLFACAYGAQRRHLPLSSAAAYAGLGTVSDLMARTDRFLSFNA